MYIGRPKLKSRENFTLEAPRGLESVVDPSIYESIPCNFKSPKSFELPLHLESKLGLVYSILSLDLSHMLLCLLVFMFYHQP